MAVEKRVIFQSKWLPYLLVAPQIVITLVFFFWPALQALYQSVLVEDAFGAHYEFVWFDNFTHLFKDDAYLGSMRITLVFSGLVAAIGMAVSLLLAVMADGVIRGATGYKTLLIWPYAVPHAIAAVLAHALERVGVTWNHVLDSDQALLLIVIAAVWNQISYNFLFFLAGLQSIPRSLIEAAAIDGAGPTRRFWTIVFPLLTPTAFFLLVVNITYAFFNTFAIVDAATSGGPGRSTEILVYKVYVDGFKGLDLGGSAAQSVILMAIVILLTFIQFRYIERKVNY